MSDVRYIKKLISVRLMWTDGTQTIIDQRDIDNMLCAADAIDMIKRAKDIAKQLIK